MKISVMGYSGAGKSTLARELASHNGADVLHFDSVHFLPGWVIRDRDEKQRITKDFLDSHDSWVIDGTYSKLFLDRRLDESDMIILLLFNRFTCFARAFRRYITYRNKTRPDMAEGCNEKFDFEFMKWLLWEGRSKAARERFSNIIRDYGGKVTVIKNQRELDRFVASLRKNSI